MIRHLALGLALLAGPALAAPSDRLVELVGRLPLGALSEPRTTIHFADLAAARAASAGDPNPAAPWLRAAPAPFAYSLRAGLEGAWGPLVGFSPDAVEAAVAVAAPPRKAVVLRLAAGAAAGVAPALVANGYAAEARDGVEALARGAEDFGVSLATRNPDDPFGGELGQSSRVLVEGDTVIQSSGWPLLLELARPATPGPSLVAMAAALDAADWEGAPVVQAAVWTSPLDFMGPDPVALALDPERMEALRETLGAQGGGGIPPWSLALAADLDAGEGGLALVLFAYPDRASAETAAARLAETYPAARSMVARAPLAEVIGATGTTSVHGDGPFVAALALRSPPEVTPERPFRMLLRGWQSRDLGLFGPG